MNGLVKFGLVFNFILGLSQLAGADPAWWSPEIKFEDCEKENYTDSKMRCYGEFYGQQVYKMDYYIKAKLEGISQERCKAKGLIVDYENMESAWMKYAQGYCSLESHCIGHCGSGHDGGTACMAGKMKEKYERLRSFIYEGIPIWGCTFTGSKRANTLVTPGHTATITSECDEGLWNCSNVKYVGSKNSDKEKSISLSGSAFSVNIDTDTSVPEGYEFKNEGFLYRVLHVGILRVTNLKSGDIVLEEKGFWQ